MWLKAWGIRWRSLCHCLIVTTTLVETTKWDRQQTFPVKLYKFLNYTRVDQSRCKLLAPHNGPTWATYFLLAHASTRAPPKWLNLYFSLWIVISEHVAPDRTAENCPRFNNTSERGTSIVFGSVRTETIRTNEEFQHDAPSVKKNTSCLSQYRTYLQLIYKNGTYMSNICLSWNLTECFQIISGIIVTLAFLCLVGHACLQLMTQLKFPKFGGRFFTGTATWNTEGIFVK